jgi:nitrile hydratase
VNSLHDLGGMHGFGKVWTMAERPAFHSDAERRVFRIMMGLVNAGWCDVDGFREAVESLPLTVYARECYPMNYFLGIETLLAERGVLLPGDLEAWMQGVKGKDWPATPPAIMEERGEAPLPALFKVGDTVTLRSINQEGHTRLPRYLRGQTGTITAERGVSDFPDTLAARAGRRPQPVYTVEFGAQDVWGESASASDRLSAEVFQDYIEAAR